MERRKLGSSNLSVRPIGLGAMPLSVHGRPDTAEAIRVIHTALDGGIDLIDTADVYCLDQNDIGHNERLIARALRERKNPVGNDPVVVATKGGLERPGGDWVVNGHPDHLRAACEASLKALATDCIDLYQLHAPDDRVPFADSVGMLARLKEQGKIRNLGLSNVSRAQIEEATGIVEIVSVQNRCNPHDVRAFHDGVLACCEQKGLAFLPYSPVGGGYGKTRTSRDPVLLEVASHHGISPFQVALAWLLAKSHLMVPIPGAGRAESARSSAAAMNVVLSPEEISKMDRAFGIA